MQKQSLLVLTLFTVASMAIAQTPVQKIPTSPGLEQALKDIDVIQAEVGQDLAEAKTIELEQEAAFKKTETTQAEVGKDLTQTHTAVPQEKTGNLTQPLHKLQSAFRQLEHKINAKGIVVHEKK